MDDDDNAQSCKRVKTSQDMGLEKSPLSERKFENPAEALRTFIAECQPIIGEKESLDELINLSQELNRL